MPPGVLEHVVPVGWIVIAVAGLLAALVAAGWAVLRGLRTLFLEGFESAIHSEQFESRVTKIVGAAFTGYTDPLARAVSDIELRQRDHGRRLGALEQDMAGLKGRLHTTRGSDIT
jgi:hypothetical protein